ncbi:hypothetical protein EDB85DRAFT_1470492 [Lactarius pseudohatsudake]|nr:hypothetical protein EDB85DRAFT_1470492 [Lactarius pseudohatsudake]
MASPPGLSPALAFIAIALVSISPYRSLSCVEPPCRLPLATFKTPLENARTVAPVVRLRRGWNYLFESSYRAAMEPSLRISPRHRTSQLTASEASPRAADLGHSRALPIRIADLGSIPA